MYYDLYSGWIAVYKIMFFKQGKKITRVACGSAHTLAWSTDKPLSSSRVPSRVPLEYDVLRDIPPLLLRNRLVLLHHASDLICPVVSMLPLNGNISLNSLRSILVYSTKEATFRKVSSSFLYSFNLFYQAKWTWHFNWTIFENVWVHICIKQCWAASFLIFIYSEEQHHSKNRVFTRLNITQKNTIDWLNIYFGRLCHHQEI
jgi:hypothetical protein